jgi:hypothetical protein
MPTYKGVTPRFSFVPGADAFVKFRPIPRDYDNTSLLEAQAMAVHQRFKGLKVPDLYSGPSAISQPDMGSFNGGQIIVPPQSAAT